MFSEKTTDKPAIITLGNAARLEIAWVDSKAKVISVFNDDGDKVAVIAPDGYNSVSCALPEVPPTKTLYRVDVKLYGSDLKVAPRYFDHADDASAWRDEVSDRDGVQSAVRHLMLDVPGDEAATLLEGSE